MNAATVLRRASIAAAASVLARIGLLAAGPGWPVLREAHADASPRPVNAPLPLPGDPNAELIGLLEMPGLLDSEPGAEAPSTMPPRRSVAVYDSASDDARVVARIDSAAQLLAREFADRQRWAVVRERRPGWFRLGMKDGRFAWAKAADVGAFHPVTELLPGRHSYLLTALWDGWVWPSPGAGYPVQVERKLAVREYPVKILATEYIGGSLWLRVEVLSGNPCDEEDVSTTAAGYVPAYTAEGKLVAWFFSRGC